MELLRAALEKAPADPAAGQFSPDLNDDPVPGVDSPRLQSLLAYLLIHRDAPLHASSWLICSGRIPPNPRPAPISEIYSITSGKPFPKQIDFWMSALKRSGGNRMPFSVDLVNLRGGRTDRKSNGKDHQAFQQALQIAADTYNGDLLPSCYDDWIFPERERLSQAYMRILEELIEILEVDQGLR